MKKLHYLMLITIGNILLSASLPAYAGTQPGNDDNNIIRTGFIRNAGQVYDMKGELCPNVLYSLQLDKMSIFITNKGLTWAIANTEQVETPIDGKLVGETPKEFIYREVQRLDMNLLNADIRMENCVEQIWDDHNGVVNYYAQGLTDKALNLHYCTKLKIKDIYPGIDWVLQVDPQKGFKADYVISQSANISDIQMEIKGATSCLLNDERNSISIITPMETFQIGELVCYTEDGQNVNADYSLKEGNLINIETANYDHTQNLIIDPFVNITRAWATYFGGSGNDFLKATRLDMVMNKIYFVGYSYSTAFPPLFNNGVSYYTSNAGYSSLADAFIMRTDLVGVREWCTYVFSTGNDLCNHVTTDLHGNVYMVGASYASTASTLGFPLLNAGGYFQGLNSCGQGAFNPMYDSFITRFDANGVMVWSTMFGSNSPCTQNYDEIFDVACNATDEVYVVGASLNQSPGGNFPFTQYGTGFLYTTYTLQQTGFIACFYPNTKLKWATFVPNLSLNGVAFDANGNIITVGFGGGPPFQNFSAFSVPQYPNAYLHGPFGTGDIDGTILTFNSNTKRIWWTYFGSTNSTNDANDFATGCSVSAWDGKLYICGRTETTSLSSPTNFPFFTGNYLNTSFPLVPNLYGTISHGWIAGFRPDFSQNWATYFPGNGQDAAVKVSVHRGGNILLCGNTTAPASGPITFPLKNPGSPFYYDGGTLSSRTEPYIAMFSDNANELFWSTYYGTDNSDETSSDIEVGGPYLVWTGNTDNSPNPSLNSLLAEVTASWQQTSYGYGNDGIIAKFKAPVNIRMAQSEENLFEGKKHKVFMSQTSNAVIVSNNIGNNNDQELTLNLLDVSGRLIKSETFRGMYNEIRVPDITNGVYIVQLIGSSETETYKISYMR
ncbi:MAG TPA: T9SS type A sorting domain-containing protein [Bacteroidia bacterium]|nr:T9SS type A sorting domain-containing protein [Bacteroidia bacterium]